MSQSAEGNLVNIYVLLTGMSNSMTEDNSTDEGVAFTYNEKNDGEILTVDLDENQVELAQDVRTPKVELSDNQKVVEQFREKVDV